MFFTTSTEKWVKTAGKLMELDLEERLLPNGFPSKKRDGRGCSAGRRVEMSLHNRPLILPLPLYVPHVSIYRGKIVLWKIMTKLHSINKLGMAKREHRVSEGLMEVSQALDY